jgi:hypothetical protein
MESTKLEIDGVIWKELFLETRKIKNQLPLTKSEESKELFYHGFVSKKSR